MTSRSASLRPYAVGETLGGGGAYIPPEKPAKETVDPEALFHSGLQLLKQEERVFEAVALLERAWRSRPLEARFVSYYGLSLALSSQRLKDAEALCDHAVKLDSRRPEFFYNLGRVRLKRNNRKGAYSAFRRGLSVDRSDARIRQELAKLGRRRPPVIPFLSRRHPLNRILGILLSRYAKTDARSPSRHELPRPGNLGAVTIPRRGER